MIVSEPVVGAAVKVREVPPLLRLATGTSLIVYVVFAPNWYSAADNVGPELPTVTVLEVPGAPLPDAVTEKVNEPVLTGATAVKSTSTLVPLFRVQDRAEEDGHPGSGGRTGATSAGGAGLDTRATDDVDIGGSRTQAFGWRHRDGAISAPGDGGADGEADRKVRRSALGHIAGGGHDVGYRARRRTYGVGAARDIGVGGHGGNRHPGHYRAHGQNRGTR